MVELTLAHSIRSELSENGRRRILVRNMHDAEKFTGILNSILEDTRLLVVDCADENTLRKSLYSYFVGDSLPLEETAFETGWRSHATEISLCSDAEGLEMVAGLHTIKKDVERFLLNSTSPPPGRSILSKIYSSFTLSLPTVICFLNYQGQDWGPSDSLSVRMPPFVVFSKDCEDHTGSDCVIEAGMMSTDSIQNYLALSGIQVALEEIMAATGGDEGLVLLYTGMQIHTGGVGHNLLGKFDSFLQGNPELALFAGSAALLGMQFIPEEVSVLSGVSTGTVFALGRRINLWKGHLSGYFLSAIVREHLLKDMLPEEKDRMLQSAAEIVMSLRGRNRRSYQTAGDLQVRAGLHSLAAESYKNAAELAEGYLTRADLYRRAALFSLNGSDDFLLQAALSLYRSEFYSEAADVLGSIKDSSDPAIDVLLGLCITSTGDSLNEWPATQKDTGIPAIVSEVLQSRRLQKQGYFYKAERILLDCAVGEPLRSVVCLVELGEQLYKRGMVENSLNTMTAAVREAVSLGADWLESKALFTSLKAWNNLGQHDKVNSNLSRLLELTLLSGNRRKLVSVYNLYANSKLLGGEYSKALNLYSSALRSLDDTSETRRMRIIILNNIGVAQRQLFRITDSLHTFMRQVRISVSSGNLSRACVAYGNMARIFIHMSNTDAAEDCLETMIEFAGLGNIVQVQDSICYISSQIAFMKGDEESAFSLIKHSERLARESGKKRRLSQLLVSTGSMFLDLKRYGEAADVLTEALAVSISAGTKLNSYLSEMKLTVAKCFLHQCHHVELLSVKHRGNPDDIYKGEQMYYHWLFTGSRQSMTAAAQFLSKGLSGGLYFHSYLHMLQKIVQNMPDSLADAIPLLHNYPSLD
ncbi:MAG: hypothetical protein KAH31_01725 [Candidatus Sabulitectum sp.]|nr:hypothetical protein [Candidatus Sabulitectum sp.]